ncbi:MAG: MerR family transcriptional regulator [Proteobacteria bacterium]|nr:MerR family transcriptional regulator [Pseudomonadota bacterium]
MLAQKRKTNLTKSEQLPPIPDKLYFTIGEVAGLCQLKPHVLRYWEQEFNQLSPSKRRGNRRYYQRAEVFLVRRIRELLYERGFTIEGARQALLESSKTQGQHQLTQTQSAIRHAVMELDKIANELDSF